MRRTVLTKEKNVETDVFGEAHGRVHMKRQDFGKLQIKKNVQTKAVQRHEKMLLKRKSRDDEAQVASTDGITLIDGDKPAMQRSKLLKR